MNYDSNGNYNNGYMNNYDSNSNSYNSYDNYNNYQNNYNYNYTQTNQAPMTNGYSSPDSYNNYGQQKQDTFLNLDDYNKTTTSSTDNYNYGNTSSYGSVDSYNQTGYNNLDTYNQNNYSQSTTDYNQSSYGTTSTDSYGTTNYGTTTSTDSYGTTNYGTTDNYSQSSYGTTSVDSYSEPSYGTTTSTDSYGSSSYGTSTDSYNQSSYGTTTGTDSYNATNYGTTTSTDSYGSTSYGTTTDSYNQSSYGTTSTDSYGTTNYGTTTDYNTTNYNTTTTTDQYSPTNYSSVPTESLTETPAAATPAPPVTPVVPETPAAPATPAATPENSFNNGFGNNGGNLYDFSTDLKDNKKKNNASLGPTKKPRKSRGLFAFLEFLIIVFLVLFILNNRGIVEIPFLDKLDNLIPNKNTSCENKEEKNDEEPPAEQKKEQKVTDNQIINEYTRKAQIVSEVGIDNNNKLSNIYAKTTKTADLSMEAKIQSIIMYYHFIDDKFKPIEDEEEFKTAFPDTQSTMDNYAYIDTSIIEHTFKEIYGEDFENESILEVCPKIWYYSPNSKYYLDATCEMVETDKKTIQYIYDVTSDEKNYYVYASVAFIEVKKDGMIAIYPNAEFKNSLKEQSIDEFANFKIDDSNYKDFSIYKYTFTKKGDQYIFSQIEKVES